MYVYTIQDDINCQEAVQRSYTISHNSILPIQSINIRGNPILPMKNYYATSKSLLESANNVRKYTLENKLLLLRQINCGK